MVIKRKSNKELEIRKKTRDRKKSPTHSTQNCIERITYTIKITHLGKRGENMELLCKVKC